MNVRVTDHSMPTIKTLRRARLCETSTRALYRRSTSAMISTTVVTPFNTSSWHEVASLSSAQLLRCVAAQMRLRKEG